MAILNDESYCTAVSSADGKYVLVPFGISVSVYHSTSGARVQHLDGHTRPITGISLHPSNSFQVWKSLPPSTNLHTTIIPTGDAVVCLEDHAFKLLIFESGKANQLS